MQCPRGLAKKFPEPDPKTASHKPGEPFLSYAAKKAPLPRQPQVVLHKTVNNPRAGPPVRWRQFLRVPGGWQFLLHMAQKVKSVGAQFHAITHWPGLGTAGWAAHVPFVHHKLSGAVEFTAAVAAHVKAWRKTQSTRQAQAEKKGKKRHVFELF